MSISFSLISGTVPFSIKERTLALTHGSIKLEQIDRYKEHNELNPLNRWISKNRALLAAACSPEINSMCFFPTDPQQTQLLYAKKGVDLNEFQGFVIENTEFPVESVEEIFNLSNYISISLSTSEFQPAVKSAVRNILSHIINDTETQAVALNIPDQGKNTTYFWTKC